MAETIHPECKPADPWDVVTIGESMIRFSPVGADRLEQSPQFEVHVGGSESNTVVGLARLGLRTCWISRLTENALGRRIASAIAAHGVDTSHLVWTSEDRIGTYFYEPGLAFRSSSVVYDRSGSAFAKFVADSLPLEPMHHARLFHATGITLALGEDCRDLLSIAREHASSRGARTSFDLNFRSRLWSMADAKSYSESWVSQSDLVFMAKRDACAWLGCSASDRDEEVLRALSRGREGRCTVMTLGPRGAIALEKDQLVAAATVEVAGVGRLGGGDSFSAGFIYGWLQGWDLATNLRWGNATAGLKHSIPGDMPLITRSEIERIVAEPIVRGVDR